MKHPVLITGVGKRLGLGLAKSLIEDGYPVIGTYRTLTTGVEQLFDSGAELHQCDLYEASQVEALIHSVTTKHSALRGLIHNASDWIPEPLTGVEPEIFDKMMAIHARIPYLLNQAFRPLLSYQSADTPIACSDIIHVSDYVADTGSRKHIAYATSKAALNSLTQSFAKQLAPAIKVNSISPALMLFNESDSPAYRDKALAKALLPKEGGLEEFIDSVKYVMQSNYITGRTIHLDGGRHLK